MKNIDSLSKDNPMRLLINFLQSRSGGARSYLRNILPYINEWPSQHSIKIYILLYREQIDSNEIIITNINCKLIVIEKIPRFKYIIEQLIVWRTIRKFKIDILFTPYQIAISFNIKSISMLRNMEAFLHWGFSYSIKNRIRNIILQLISIYTLKKSDAIIAVSDFSKEFMIKNLNISESKITRIYHGRDTRFSPIQSSEDNNILHDFGLTDKSYIFTNGSMLPYRKLDIILYAFANARYANNIKLFIAGDGTDLNYKNKISNIIKKYHLENKVTLLGFIDINKIVILYRHCKLFITATEIEACPNIAIEAMSTGCTVLASNKPPLPEMFRDKAVYFQSGNSIDLANKLDELLLEEEVNSNIDYNLERFSWKQCADDTLQVIISLYYKKDITS